MTLVVTVPTMAVAEDWHGRPVIDDAGAWWLVPAALAVTGFFVGGVLSVRRSRGTRARRYRWRAAGTGALVGGLASGILVAADGVRRLLVNPTLPAGVVDYWIEAAVVAVVVSAVGALVAAVSSGRRAR